MPRTLAQWTGVAVTAIVVSGSDMDLLLAVPLGLLAGALAAYFSSLPGRAGQSMIGTVRALVMPLIGHARSALAKVPHVRAVGACVVALFAGMWIGNFIETGRAIARESMAVAKAVAEHDKDARTREDAVVSDAVLQVDNETKRQLKALADADEAADALAIDSYRRLDRQHRAVRAQLEEEKLAYESLRKANAQLAEDHDILLRSCGPVAAGG